ncbi:MAG: hypothetical protein HQK59_08165 [Deltaproteobacteria bacterium]|nr:hypothetical protein [Deltaproteobacteria bacterium]
MRQLLFDELSDQDMAKIREYLIDAGEPSEVGGLYWITLHDDLLNENQFHHHQCKPFSFAVEVGNNWVKFELLIRSRSTMSCSCTGYAGEVQTAFILRFANNLIEKLNLKT